MPRRPVPRHRRAGPQRLSRRRRHDTPLPRILFIVDEFQEFFVEDDKIAQEVALLLDRLVRQGRAFGIHVHLGSQTLGGAYSLARSTLGQMAVRIALQCSEADAHLILSEDNSAARLLTRPGEAIYNDANGMVEGNNFFQVVWLSDDRREEYLQSIHELARRPATGPRPRRSSSRATCRPIAAKNHLLARPPRCADWPEPPKADHAWLGDAIAIKDPTAAVFRPQSGSNLLIVGQNDETALGHAVRPARHRRPARRQRAPTAASGSSCSTAAPSTRRWPASSAKLARLRPAPGQGRHRCASSPRRSPRSPRRSNAGRRIPRSQSPPIYLLIYDLQRFRDLRKADDDFGFSPLRRGRRPTRPRSSSPPSSATARRSGVHTLVWCDSLNNLNRTFDRQSLREFEIRVLFQMSANDSSTLIDSPAAGKLGENRALFFSEEEGRTEKFRPYGLPDRRLVSRASAPGSTRGPPSSRPRSPSRRRPRPSPNPSRPTATPPSRPGSASPSSGDEQSSMGPAQEERLDGTPDAQASESG